MLPELGHYTLILALSMAIIQASIPLLGAWRGHVAYMQLSRYTAFGQLFFVGFSFFALAYCFISNDFSVAYVAENSNTKLPIIYRFCAVWGAHEGSLLLWVFILSIWSTAVSVFSRHLPLEMLARVLSVLALVSIGFYLFLLITSDPFQRLLPNVPVNGQDLNPILQDPGLAIHPPMLYMGYVGFSVAFAFAIAALISGRLDAVWARWSRPWTTVAWCFLTFGIILGSWWAYRELGWGGFWFWDPVENASFLPWLVGTALIHSLAVTDKRNVFKAWTVLLAVSAFSLSLLGTFLVRSGILISVHAFAIDPARGLFLLQYLFIVIGGSLILYAWRAVRIVNTGHFYLWSRETMLLANNVLLFVAMITVLLGTLYPLIMSALDLGKISVGAPYFNMVFIPIILPLLFLLGIGPLFQWQQTNLLSFIWRLLIIFVVVFLLACLLLWIFGERFTWLVILSLTLAFWIIANTLSHLKGNFRRQWAMVLAHVGVGITVLGLVLTTQYSEQRNLSMHLGETVRVGPYDFTFQGVSALSGPNYNGVQANFLIHKQGKTIGRLQPQLRNFSIQQTTIAKTAINEGIFRDLYIALGSSLSKNVWEVRIYYKPFIRWIWAGGWLMIIGGIIALFDRRYRIREQRS